MAAQSSHLPAGCQAFAELDGALFGDILEIKAKCRPTLFAHDSISSNGYLETSLIQADTMLAPPREVGASLLTGGGASGTLLLNQEGGTSALTQENLMALDATMSSALVSAETKELPISPGNVARHLSENRISGYAQIHPQHTIQACPPRADISEHMRACRSVLLAHGYNTSALTEEESMDIISEDENVDLLASRIRARISNKKALKIARNLRKEKQQAQSVRLNRITHHRSVSLTKLDIYCDGSASDDGFGGCGIAYLDNNGTWKTETIALREIKNSLHVEMHGIVAALERAFQLVGEASTKPHIVTIFTDCVPAMHRIGGITPITARTFSEKRVVEIATEFEKHHVELGITWVKGHSTSVGNNKSDRAARDGMRHSKAAKLTDKELLDMLMRRM